MLEHLPHDGANEDARATLSVMAYHARVTAEKVAVAALEDWVYSSLEAAYDANDHATNYGAMEGASHPFCLPIYACIHLVEILGSTDVITDSANDMLSKIRPSAYTHVRVVNRFDRTNFCCTVSFQRIDAEAA